jgi:hypothetical protein
MLTTQLCRTLGVTAPVFSVGMGALAVSLGRRFLCSEEALAEPAYIERVVRSTAEDTVYTTLFNDRWLVRRLSALARAAGFEVSPVKSYGIVATLEPRLTPTWVDRGAEARLAAGHIGPELATALKAETRRRAAEGAWFGYMAYASLIARKPG